VYIFEVQYHKRFFLRQVCKQKLFFLCSFAYVLRYLEKVVCYANLLLLDITQESFIVYQCSNSACGLRFPAKQSVVLQSCPSCGSSLAKVKAYAAYQAPTNITQPKRSLSVFCDNIRSAYNVGSIFRTSEGCGVKHVYLGGISPTPKHSQVQKTALGAQELVSWSYHINGLEAIKTLQPDHTIWALESMQEAELFSAELDVPDSLVLVIGNEVTGVDPEILALCSKTVALPMVGQKQSLNVASAAAVALYWLQFG
jgi:23S rRNA (guanosine2251-2'-O)-methyltransferase